MACSSQKQSSGTRMSRDFATRLAHHSRGDHVGDPSEISGAVDHWRRQVGGGLDSRRPTRPERLGLGGKEILALRAVRGNLASDKRRAAAGPHRGSGRPSLRS
jgi:hypothetical protein